MLPSPPLLLITDRTQTKWPLSETVAQALQGGCRWVMLREKDLPPDALRSLAMELKQICAAHSAVLTINRDLATARAVGAQGVHLPAGASVEAARTSLGPQASIGVSAHNAGELARAEAEGADYATLSPVFESESKPGYGPVLGLSGLKELAARSGLPVVALGGVCPGRAGRCMDSGAAGIAVMGAIMAAQRPAEATRRLLRELPAD